MALPELSALLTFSFRTCLIAQSHIYRVWVSLIMRLSFYSLERRDQPSRSRLRRSTRAGLLGIAIRKREIPAARHRYELF